ncbi:MAG: MBL fold metallo-hydrolase [Ignavibacteria bacterium]|nr:MBL fold metallo-hydrolase [Ignavibacteria bacterium]
MYYSRRQFLISAASFALSYRLLNPNKLNPFGLKQEKRKARLVLLGTKGGPRVGATGRHNPSTLILINDQAYLIDCGYGTSRQLLKAGVPLNNLHYLFITHHHSDHNLEYGTLVYNAWITRLPLLINSYGPIGSEKMLNAFFEYMRYDIDVRMDDEGRSDPRKSVFAHEIPGPGTVLQNDDVKVTVCLVNHPKVKQAFAFRFDTEDRSIVISGDTAYWPKLADFAKGADVLVHEVLYLPGVENLIRRLPDARRLREHLLASHTRTEDVGRIAARAGVKTLVLTHFVPGDDPSITDEQWTEGIRKYFKGQIIVGKDIMEI